MSEKQNNESLQDIISRWKRETQNAAQQAAKELKALAQRLPESVIKVEMEYSGSDDSSNSPYTTYRDQSNEEVEIDIDLEEAIETCFWRMIDAGHSGWENNDGGRGEVVWDIKDAKVTINHVDYVVEEVECDEEVFEL